MFLWLPSMRVGGKEKEKTGKQQIKVRLVLLFCRYSDQKKYVPDGLSYYAAPFLSPHLVFDVH